MSEFLDINGARTFLTEARKEFLSKSDGLTKVENPTAGNVPTLQSDGTLANSSVPVADIVTKVSGKDLSTNDYTTAEKNKLAGIEANANNYSLPTASSSVVGGMKLYSDIGTNTDGTMTQAAIKTAIENGNSVTKLIVAGSDSTVNAATTNGNTYLRLFDDNIARNSIKIAGSGTVSISSDANGNITIDGGGSLIKLVMPTQNGTVTYNNGISQSPSWTDYNPEQIEMTGETSATNAGTHTVHLKPTGNCVWEDGTQATKDTTWTMDKAAGVLSLSANSADIKVGATSNVTLTTAGDGAITVTSSDISVATVSRNDNTITITGAKAGTTTITVSQAEGSNHLAPISKTITVNVSKTVVTVPTVTNTSKTYNGSIQSPTVSNEPSSTEVNCTGKSATDAGDYTLKYSLTDTNKYVWSDNSISDKSTSWSIAKVAGSLTLSASSGTVPKGGTATFTITAVGDGAITITSSDTSVATASINGNTVTITGVKIGTTTITVSQAEGTNHLAPANKTYTATVELIINNTLNDNAWGVISEVSQLGIGDTYWDVGDCKEIELNGNIGSRLTLTNQKLCVFILHFNYAMNGTAENNIIWGGFKSALTDGIDVALVDSTYGNSPKDGTINFSMNHIGQSSDSTANGYYGTNYGGWKGTDLRYDILGATSTAPSEYNQLKSTANVGYDATAATLANPKADTLLAALPSDLRSVLRLWTRWVDAVGNKSNVDANIQPTVDAITLLAEFEVFGSRTYANDYEKNHQSQMDYYVAGNGKKRYSHNDTSSAVWWWECSPRYNGINYFTYVDTSGGADYNIAYISGCVAPAFKT